MVQQIERVIQLAVVNMIMKGDDKRIVIIALLIYGCILTEKGLVLCIINGFIIIISDIIKAKSTVVKL